MRKKEMIAMLLAGARTILKFRGVRLPRMIWKQKSRIFSLIEYVKLYQEGDETFEARLQLLSEEREKLEEQKAQIESAINRLNHKISKYEEAVKTGVLNWEENSSCI